MWVFFLTNTRTKIKYNWSGTPHCNKSTRSLASSLLIQFPVPSLCPSAIQLQHQQCSPLLLPYVYAEAATLFVCFFFLFILSKKSSLCSLFVRLNSSKGRVFLLVLARSTAALWFLSLTLFSNSYKRRLERQTNFCGANPKMETHTVENLPIYWTGGWIIALLNSVLWITSEVC